MLSSYKTGDLTSHQWHLNNTGQSNFVISHGTTGADININGVTQTGRGVVVAIVDTGLEITHEDLVDNVVPNGSRNFKDGIDINDNHGASVAGIIGAKDNGIGPKGVAPNIHLKANSNLTWRDVKHILANTSEKIDSNIANVTIVVNGVNYIAEPEWLTNTAGYNFHNYYGFGRVDAARAVASATAYVANSLGTLGTIAFTTSPGTSIPNFNASGISSVIASTSTLSVEAVNIFVNITHARSGELALELTSPNGTKSMILHPQNAFLTYGDSNLFTEFASNAFYGESARGNWTLKVVDTDNGNSAVGTLNSWAIGFYGH